MSCKGRLVVGYHNNEMVGVAKDAFNKDIILAELEERSAMDEDGDETPEHSKKCQEEAKEKKATIPSLAKHFLVVIATTISASAKHKHTFLVARYGLSSIDADYLDDVLGKSYIALAKDGWIAVQVTGDGASENRSYFKKKATISARDVFDGHYDEEETLAGLPLDFKIAFPHPDKYLRDSGIIITIGGEMPHWGKKFRNNTESKTRILTYNGQEMTLTMLKDIWIASGDSDATTASLRKYKFTWDHFLLNSYNKMRVFLALQALSQTMINMVKDYCLPIEQGGMGAGDIDDYESFITIISAVNRLVDIMNGVRFKNGQDKQVFLIDCPEHPHVFELFDILRLFEDWKDDTGGFTHEYITRQTYEDLVWMVFGVAAMACTYLEDDCSLVFHQGRGGSDVCKHFFANMRNDNPNHNLQQCR